MNFAQGACITALQPSFIRVELARFVGIPQMVVVGLPTKAISEAKERLIAIVKSLGIKLPHCRFLFNLYPVSTTKHGSGLDLPMLVALLSSLGVLKREIVISERQLWLGELRLDGTICPITGIPFMLEAAAQLGYEEVWCSSQCQNQFSQIEYGVRIRTINHISELVNLDENQRRKLNRNQIFPQKITSVQLSQQNQLELPSTDWQVLLSQPMVEKALLIAAAGWHHTLLVGPPGLGKTTVAALLIELLPALQSDELSQVVKVQSLVNSNQNSTLRRSCIQVNAQSTMTNLIGSAKQNYLGAVSRAHKGVLFLDEVSEFS